MAELRHPAASHELPSFITSPGETDVLMVVMSVFLALAVVMFGIMFLRLHTLPERMAHKSHKIQFEIVAVLGLIALLTHMHIFWIAGLVLAMIDFPDFGTSLGRIAASTEKIAGIEPSDGATELQPEAVAASIKQTREAAAGVEVRMHEVAREGEGGALSTVLTPRWHAKMS
jgi:NADH:ubiquinone oxidoreductase subunit 5 (subunit L)/multisubunit Na+/H+ antiporter MnhA subunit